MPIVQNMALQPFNTFGVAARARYFASIHRGDELLSLLDDPAFVATPMVILGGGSNLLFTRDFDGLVLKNDIRGLQVLKEDRQSALVRAGAGEDWDAFVRWTLNHRFYGLENLALIPGLVGASPVQNIGDFDRALTVLAQFEATPDTIGMTIACLEALGREPEAQELRQQWAAASRANPPGGN